MSMEETVRRINELARKAKSVGLTESETEERTVLRQTYIEAMRASLRSQLDSIEFVDENPQQ
jgi:uncharacterized protein YnzC (UPF0291/DUF896 family)